VNVLCLVSKELYRLAQDDRHWRTFIELTPKDGSVEPSSRLCHASTIYDGGLYVHGGHNTIPDTQLFFEVKDDLWKYSFASKQWTNILPADGYLFPSKTEHSAVVWGNKMWLFGGYAGNQFTGNLFFYDFNSGVCEQVQTEGDQPPIRSAHVGVAYQDSMYIFGGWNGRVQNNELYR